MTEQNYNMKGKGVVVAVGGVCLCLHVHTSNIHLNIKKKKAKHNKGKKERELECWYQSPGSVTNSCQKGNVALWQLEKDQGGEQQLHAQQLTTGIWL